MKAPTLTAFLYLSLISISYSQRINVTVLGLIANNKAYYIRDTQHHPIASSTVIQTAVNLALNDISIYCPNRSIELSLFTVDTECDPARGAWSISKYALGSEQPVIILGPSCDSTANHIIDITSKFTNLLTVSYEAESSHLIQHSSSFQTNPAYVVHFKALHRLLQHFNWRKICLIVENGNPIYTLAREELGRFLNESFQILESIPEPSNNSTFCRIYIVLSSLEYFINVALLNSHIIHQWIYIGDINTESVLVKYSQQVISSVLQNTISLSFKYLNATDEISRKKIEFRSRLVNLLQSGDIIDNYNERVAQRAYDAMWLIHHGLETATQKDNINLLECLPLGGQEKESKRLRRQLEKSFATVNFEGISGPIHFNNTQRHYVLTDIVISQWQDTYLIPIGLTFTNDTTSWDYYGNDFSWERPPKDSPLNTLDKLPIWILVLLLCMSGLGCVLVLAMLSINCYFRHCDIIKASSPHINSIILVGNLLGFLSITFMTFIGAEFLSDNTRSLCCNISIWSISLAFTIAFGGLLTKTWRVYVVFRNPWNKQRFYKDKVLVVISLTIVIIEGSILFAWMGLAPLKLKRQFKLEPDVTIETTTCKSDEPNLVPPLLSFLLLYKFLLLFFGCYVAYKVRKIKIKIFNDSNLIAAAIYCLLVAMSVGAIVTTFVIMESSVMWRYIMLGK